MNTTAALFKKELHTAKWFLLGGILLFWSFPLLEAVGNYCNKGRLETHIASDMSWAFGGLFAIITASGLVCLEMPKGLYEFWRSRPVRLFPYLAVKYIVGLVVTLLVINIPVLLETILLWRGYSDAFQQGIVFLHTFIIVLLYSIAFWAGHLFGNMTEAAIISFAAALLVYFIPVLAPALEPVSFFNQVLNGLAPRIEIVPIHPDGVPVSPDNPFTRWGGGIDGTRYVCWFPVSEKSVMMIYIFKGFLLFAGTMTGLSTAMIVGAWLCLKYHLHIRLGLKSICWSLGLVALSLFSAVAFSIGSNLKCLAKNSLPAEKDEYTIRDEYTINSCFEREGGVLLGGHYCKSSQHYDMLHIDRISEEPFYAYRYEAFALEKQLPTQIMMHTKRKIAWTSRRPDIVYYLGINRNGPDNNIHQQFNLYVIKLDETSHVAGIENELLLGEYDAKQIETEAYQEKIKLAEQTLYILLPDGVAVIDIGGDALPRLLIKVRRPGRSGNMFLPVPTDDLLSQEQKREITQCFGLDDYQTSASDSDRYAEAGENFVSIYKTGTINEETMAQEKIAEYRKMPLEKLTQKSARTMILKGDRVFLLNYGASLTVFQVNESARILKKVGHYAASEARFYDMFLRDDGNIALIGNNQIHIVQPPAAKKN